MKIQLHSRFFHLLWRIWPKKKTEIDGYQIVYCALPWWLMFTDGTARLRFETGMFIAHKPSKTLMIFVSSRQSQQYQRYSIYHEYWEGQCFLTDNIRSFEQVFKRSIEALQIYVPDIESRLKVAIDRYSSPKAKRDHIYHIFALVCELALMEKDLPRPLFSKLLAEALEKRT